MNKDERYHGLIANLKSKDSWKTKDEFINCFNAIMVELLTWGDPWMHSEINKKFIQKFRDYKNNISVEDRILRAKKNLNIQNIIRK